MDPNPQAIRNARAPLTLEQIRTAAPSAFAAQPFEGMSHRYAYIPTSEVIRGMMQAGFQPFAASQSRTSIAEKRAFTKHMVRFRAPMDMSIAKVGDVFPEVVLVNSHDGSSAYKLMAGLYRLVCTNGLIVADSMIESVSIKHTGNVIEAVATGSIQLVEKMPVCVDAIARWRDIQLSAHEQTAYAQAAHVLRFADADGTLDTPIQPAQLLRPRRVEDNKADLWSTFNRVQENVIRGGLRAYRSGATRRTTSREVKGINEDVRLNRALWTLTETLAGLHTASA